MRQVSGPIEGSTPKVDAIYTLLEKHDTPSRDRACAQGRVTVPGGRFPCPPRPPSPRFVIASAEKGILHRSTMMSMRLEQTPDGVHRSYDPDSRLPSGGDIRVRRASAATAAASSPGSTGLARCIS
jgi:hypothetical protein